MPYVNADEITTQLGLDPSLRQSQIVAGKIAVGKIKEFVSEQKDFVVETTLSGKYYEKLVRELKEAGWGVNVILVSCGGIEQSKERIKKRVTSGGHNVPDEIVERRWPDTIEKTADFVELADRGWILDNSAENLTPKLVAKIQNGKIIEHREEQNIPHIFDKLQERNLLAGSKLFTNGKTMEI